MKYLGRWLRVFCHYLDTVSPVRSSVQIEVDILLLVVICNERVQVILRMCATIINLSFALRTPSSLQGIQRGLTDL